MKKDKNNTATPANDLSRDIAAQYPAGQRKICAFVELVC